MIRSILVVAAALCLVAPACRLLGADNYPQTHGSADVSPKESTNNDGSDNSNGIGVIWSSLVGAFIGFAVAYIQKAVDSRSTFRVRIRMIRNTICRESEPSMGDLDVLLESTVDRLAEAVFEVGPSAFPDEKESLIKLLEQYQQAKYWPERVGRPAALYDNPIPEGSGLPDEKAVRRRMIDIVDAMEREI